MLVTLKPLISDSSWYKKNNAPNGSPAYHSLLNRSLPHSVSSSKTPCVRFVKVRGCGRHDYYSRVTLKNVIATLKHEEIHHVLDVIGEYEANDAFDVFHKDYYDVCRILNCSNHQVTA